MSRFVQGADRRQQTLPPECLDDYVGEDNPVRVIDVFVDELDLIGLSFEVMTPASPVSRFCSTNVIALRRSVAGPPCAPSPRMGATS